MVRKADQIELVDSSPEQLRRRMLHGNIYPKEKVPQALANFFRADNLIGLRELALRFLADETEEELLEHLRRRQDQTLWETTERIMVGVTDAPGFDLILRRAARMTARSKGELHVVHVVRGDAVVRSGENPIEKRERVALDVGARVGRATRGRRCRDADGLRRDAPRSPRSCSVRVDGAGGASSGREARSSGRCSVLPRSRTSTCTSSRGLRCQRSETQAIGRQAAPRGRPRPTEWRRGVASLGVTPA